MKLKLLKKTIAVIGVAAMMTMSLSGCGSDDKKSTIKGMDPDAVLLTVGDETVSLKEGYFLVKLQQAQYQALASQYYGEEWYASDLFGTGETFQDYYKRFYIDILERICLAKQHMKELGVELTADEKSDIEKVADSFMEENAKSAQEAMMADKDTIVDILQGMKILEKVSAKSVEGVNQDISDQELHDAAYTKTYSYVYTSFQKTGEDGKATSITPAEQEDATAKLNAVREKVIAGEDFDTAVSGQGLQVSEHTYTPGDDSDNLKEINGYMDTLQIGDVSEVVPLDTTGIFIGHLDSDNADKLGDEEVIKNAKDGIMNERKYDMFKGIVEEWKTGVNVKVDNDLWKKVTMEDKLAALTTK